ncbi:hypothetical protein INT44_005700 [Umbelopsis vinacea]|uniref:Uncharacterized protein n=1 Tax=Umbelopsis vinacea TaxID=44442 RepID=A0A8H7UH02_9FUNG|nr:hypothetical protein INT44_005700 [Umbelopsis vinacea]
MRGIRFYSQSQQALRGWRKYAHQFRDKPASYLTSFAILHELTAIVPLPLVYYFLDYSQLNIPVPEDAITEGNRVISKMRTKYGYEPLDPNSRVMLNMVASYAVVKVNFLFPRNWIIKAFLPLRIAASVAMTPFLAEKAVGPFVRTVSRFARPAK